MVKGLSAGFFALPLLEQKTKVSILYFYVYYTFFEHKM